MRQLGGQRGHRTSAARPATEPQNHADDEHQRRRDDRDAADHEGRVTVIPIATIRQAERCRDRLRRGVGEHRGDATLGYGDHAGTAIGDLIRLPLGFRRFELRTRHIACTLGGITRLLCRFLGRATHLCRLCGGHFTGILHDRHRHELSPLRSCARRARPVRPEPPVARRLRTTCATSSAGSR